MTIFENTNIGTLWIAIINQAEQVRKTRCPYGDRVILRLCQMMAFDKLVVFSKSTTRIRYNTGTIDGSTYPRRIFRNYRINCVNFS
jgi:hypothetical protein